MQKAFFQLAFLAAFPTVFFGQIPRKYTADLPEKIGLLTSTGQPFRAALFDFGERIESFHIDSLTSSGIAFMGGRGRTSAIFSLNLEKGLIDWTQRVNFRNSRVWLRPNDFIVEKMGKTALFDRKTGKENWETNEELVFVPPGQNIGIGFSSRANAQIIEICGVDLRDGKTLWKREVRKKAGWQRTEMIGPNEALLLAGGLHVADLRTGYGWDREAEISEAKGSVEAIVVAGALGGLLGGLVASAIAPPSVAMGLHSNHLSDKNSIFLATRDEVARLDRATGEPIWRTKLPEKWGSSSKIEFRGGDLFMLNLGLASNTGSPVGHGKAFLARFDSATGRQIFLQKIGGEGTAIRSFRALGEGFFFLQNDQITWHDGKGEMKIRSIDSRKTGELFKLTGFCDDRVFRKTANGSFVSIGSDWPKTIGFWTELKNICLFGEALKFREELFWDDFFVQKATNGQLRVLAQPDGKFFFLIDAAGRKIADLPPVQKAQFTRDRLILIDGEKMHLVDLADLR